MSEIPIGNARTALEQKAVVDWMSREAQMLNTEIQLKQSNIDNLEAQTVILRDETGAVIARLNSLT